MVLTLRMTRPYCLHCGRDLARVMGSPWFHRADHQRQCNETDRTTYAVPTRDWRWLKNWRWPRP
jgi:hypothetical protein